MSKKTIILFYGLFSQNLSYDWIPYGVLFVYSRLKSIGFTPILIHEYKDKNYEEILKRHAKDTLLFGVSAMTGYQIKSGVNAIKTFRKYAPDVPIIWGGAHATAMPYNTLNSEYADYVCVGHATDNFLNFVIALRDDKCDLNKFLDILTLSYFSDKKNKEYKIVDFKNNLSTDPPIAFEDFDFSYLITSNRVLNYISSVGCPGTCTFCSWGGKHLWTSFPIKKILDEIEYLVNRYKLTSLWFADPDLTVRRQNVLDLAQGIIDRRLNIYWRGNARAPELLKFSRDDFVLLEESGCDRFFIGVENVNQDVQKAYKKGFGTNLIDKVVESIKDFKIQLMMSFILANPIGPLSDIEENAEQLNKWIKVNPNVRFQICFYTPYPGTPMTDIAIKKGYSPPVNLEGYGEDPYFIDIDRSMKKVDWLTPEDSADYIKRFLKNFPKIMNSPEWNWRNNKNSATKSNI